MRTSRMAERARLGEGRERLSEVGCVAPGGVGLSSGAEGRGFFFVPDDGNVLCILYLVSWPRCYPIHVVGVLLG